MGEQGFASRSFDNSHPFVLGANMSRIHWRVFVSSVVLLLFRQPSAEAQYPRVPQEIGREAVRRMREADRRSDEAWQKAQPVIKEWDAKGKPYIPWAAKPSDLPQAEIPAFPAHRAVACTATAAAAARYSWSLI